MKTPADPTELLAQNQWLQQVQTQQKLNQLQQLRLEKLAQAENQSALEPQSPQVIRLLNESRAIKEVIDLLSKPLS